MIDQKQIFSEFYKLCLQQQKTDSKYAVLDHKDGVFCDQYIEFAYQVFSYLRREKEGSRVMACFDQWREMHYGETKKSGVFFAYIEALMSEHISEILYRWFVLTGSHTQQKEALYRTFILAGMCTQIEP